MLTGGPINSPSRVAPLRLYQQGPLLDTHVRHVTTTHNPRHLAVFFLTSVSIFFNPNVLPSLLV
jgi:hypothetical protein